MIAKTAMTAETFTDSCTTPHLHEYLAEDMTYQRSWQNTALASPIGHVLSVVQESVDTSSMSLHYVRVKGQYHEKPAQ